jgi:hypothetical protein
MWKNCKKNEKIRTYSRGKYSETAQETDTPPRKAQISLFRPIALPQNSRLEPSACFQNPHKPLLKPAATSNRLHPCPQRPHRTEEARGRENARKNRERSGDVGGGAAAGAGRAEAARGPRQAPPRPVPPRQRNPQR